MSNILRKTMIKPYFYILPIIAIIFFIVIYFRYQKNDVKIDCVCKDERFNNYFVKSVYMLTGERFDEEVQVDGVSEINDLFLAAHFIEVNTGIKSRLKLNHWGLFYESKSDSEADLEEWKEWYSHNKCTMNMIKADSLLNCYQKSNGIIQENWEEAILNYPLYY